MKKLIIQIPCYNEEKVLGTVLKQLPRFLAGFGKVEWLVIDDGSDDRTVEVAKSFLVDHVLSFSKHQGLAKAYIEGLQFALQKDADFIVNIDADNQYAVEDISTLLEPLIEGRADLVLGTRELSKFPTLPFHKRFLYQIASVIVGAITGYKVSDPTSGFRATSADTARKLKVLGRYTYTIETLIQASFIGLRVLSLPVRTNSVCRPSRLINSTSQYIRETIFSITRSLYHYGITKKFKLLFETIEFPSKKSYTLDT